MCGCVGSTGVLARVAAVVETAQVSIVLISEAAPPDAGTDVVSMVEILEMRVCPQPA